MKPWTPYARKITIRPETGKSRLQFQPQYKQISTMPRSSIVVSALLLSIIALTSCDTNLEDSPLTRVTIEGKQYPFVKIGDQLWTSSNYEGPGGVSYDALNTRPEYGKYYLKTELDAIVVPAGWRIPTLEDYSQLAQSYGIPVPSKLSDGEAIKALISTVNWNNAKGTNTSGFNAYPANYIFQDSNPTEGDIAEFWTADGETFSIQEAGTNLGSLRISLYQSNSPEYRFNIRFVKDAE
jgi:uncharacterized protein (TIGR02145 family)